MRPPGPTGTDGEAGRAFYQARLRFWCGIGLVISTAFFVTGWLVSPLYGEARPGWQPPALHAATLLLMGVAWLACRHGRWTRGQLDLIDGGSLILICAGFGAQLLWVHPDLLTKHRTAQLLVLTTLLVGRSIFVPSTAHRTLWLSLGAAGTILAASALTLRGAQGDVALLGWLDMVWASLWSGSAIAIATVASALIYGLRQEVRQAQRLGQYTLREKLGAGGMGVVYKASHAMLRRPTAVKLLPPDRSGDQPIRRFEREVQLTASLTHPNTVAIYDYGRTPDGIFYYAMEYLEGIDLGVLVREDGPQPPARVRSILLQVCGALGEAHAVGLIHRDVKPGNIMLCQRGGLRDVVKVLDFGLVKDLGAAAEPELTNVETIVGTPHYLAPESIAAPDEVDARADVYAVGAVAYVLLTGRPVFEGRTTVEVCSHHLRSTPEPPSKRLGRPVPPDLEALVLACLEKDLADRPRSMEALAHSLRECADLGEWSEASAAAWWRERGRTILEARKPPAPDEGAPTLSVDLRRRLAEFSPPHAG